MVETTLNILINGFDDHCRAFADITRRARDRFAARDGKAGRRDILERLSLSQPRSGQPWINFDNTICYNLIRR